MKKYILCIIIFCIYILLYLLFKPSEEKQILPLYDSNLSPWVDLPQTKQISATLRLTTITKDICLAEVTLKNISDKTLIIDLYSIPINSYQNDFFIIKDLENGKKINYTGSFITPQPYDIYDCIPIKSNQEIQLTVDLFKIYSGMKGIKALEIKYSWVFSYYEENSFNINFANEKIESNSIYLYKFCK